MNEQQLAEIKHSIEILKSCNPENEPLYEQVCAYELVVSKTITALQSIIAQDALHKMAEESRTNGLRLADWDKIGCVNHDCDQCKAVQEPIGRFTGRFWTDDAHNRMMCEVVCDVIPTAGAALYTTPPAAQPVLKTYHDGKPWPVQPSQSAPDYAWPTIADYEKEVGFEVNDAFKAAWTMARTTNDLFKQMGANHD
jgi:hypothetical protein